MTRDNVPNGTQPPLDEAPERSDPVRRVGEELFRQTGQSRPRCARGRTLGNTSDYRGGYIGADGRLPNGGRRVRRLDRYGTGRRLGVSRTLWD
ncbi:hypothetical protein [Streptomyces halstedii]|uniref:hypothetical protein n=1 Tax=Streptomyces halstedii TaxID=1944 RepID=UPI00381B006B